MSATGDRPPIITRIDLSNFRSHRSTSMACDAGIVALHGANGSGKTSILEALSMLGPTRGLRSGGAESAARLPEGSGWHMRAEIRSRTNPVVVETELAIAGGRSRRARINGANARRAQLVEVLRVIWATPSMDRIWNDSTAERRRLLDRATAAFHGSHALAASRYERAMRERNRLLREGPDDPTWLTALETRMAGYGAQISRNRAELLERIAAHAERASILSEPAEFAILDPGVNAVPGDGFGGGSAVWGEARLASVLRSGRGRDAAAGKTLSGPHRADLAACLRISGRSAETASTGEQKGILIAFTLACARALAEEPQATVLLLDEVLAHFDARRRETLLEELEDLPSQVWLTATDPALYAPLGSAAARFAVSRPDGESRLTRQ